MADIFQPIINGISERMWLAGLAMAHHGSCHGRASEDDITRWFGDSKANVTKADIIAKQAFDIADAIIAFS